MIDQRTTHFDFPQPHPSNRLDEDVSRLRETIQSIDNLLNWAAQRIDSDDPIGTIPALVTAAKAAKADILQLIPASAAAFAYDAEGRVAQITETLPGGAARETTFVYSGSVLATETTVCDGIARRTTYNYLNGRVSSTTRVIL